MTSVLNSPNPYLSDNFAPIEEEISTDSLQIIGELPEELSGMFVRNGPNPQFTPLGQYHWFDGDAMLHGLRISQGKASYLNRYVRTHKFKTEKEQGKALWTGLLEPPQPNHPFGTDTNTANTALIYHGGQLLALWEGGSPYALTVPQLETKGKHTFNDKLQSPFTAHPKIDPVTGEMMFIGYSLTQPPYLYYGIVSAEGELLRTLPIELPVGGMVHDFAITANYTIFFDLPVHFRPERMAQGQHPLGFDPHSPSRFGILPRHGESEQIRWFEMPSCYIYHTLNAYEDNDEIVLLACRMSATNVFVTNEDDRIADGDIPYLYRWRFNLKTGQGTEEKLDEIPSEFPRINDNFMGKKGKYGYSAKIAPSQTPLFNGLIKYDLETGRSEHHEFGQGRYGGEAVFAPRLNASQEDDGWLVTYVYDESAQTSELVVINAQDFSGDAIARVIIPQRVPYGFHGTWLTEPQLTGTSVS
ncbi:MAG: carotenoid oxygenase family protein [Microcystaceae cyanobacterium]